MGLIRDVAVQGPTTQDTIPVALAHYSMGVIKHVVEQEPTTQVTTPVVVGFYVMEGDVNDLTFHKRTRAFNA